MKRDILATLPLFLGSFSLLTVVYLLKPFEILSCLSDSDQGIVAFCCFACLVAAQMFGNAVGDLIIIFLKRRKCNAHS